MYSETPGLEGTLENNNAIENFNTIENHNTLENNNTIENFNTIENHNTLENNNTIENFNTIENHNTLENNNTIENNNRIENNNTHNCNNMNHHKCERISETQVESIELPNALIANRFKCWGRRRERERREENIISCLEGDIKSRRGKSMKRTRRGGWGIPISDHRSVSTERNGDKKREKCCRGEVLQGREGRGEENREYFSNVQGDEMMYYPLFKPSVLLEEMEACDSGEYGTDSDSEIQASSLASERWTENRPYEREGKMYVVDGVQRMLYKMDRSLCYLQRKVARAARMV